MIAFWAVAGVLSAAAAGLILKRAADAAKDAGAADPTLALYRRQLSEIDDLADRGLLGEAERKSAHAEAARRLLGAADHAEPAWAAGGHRGTVLATAFLAPALAAALYFWVGSPGMPDQPFAERLAAWRTADPTTLTPPQIAAVLKDRLKATPNDPEGLRFLAMMEAASGNFGEARRALRRAIEAAPQRADLWELLGATLTAEAQGQASPGAAAAFREALKRDPKSIPARFELARQQILAGERDAGLAVWRGLLAEMPADDPRRPDLAAAIAEAEAPPAAAAPQPDIRAMVEGLAARLAASPDDPEGWVRLVRSYAVLGDAAKRDAALAKAKARYAGKPEVIRALEDAARTEPMR